MTYKPLEQEVGDFLRTQTANPKLYSNDLRHQYASAIMAQKYGENQAKFLGDLNEFFNFNASGRYDTEIDKYNNQIGRKYAQMYPNYTKQQFLNEFYKNNYEIQQQRKKDIGF